MSGPWEKYQKQGSTPAAGGAPEGPWTKYQKGGDDAPAPAPQQPMSLGTMAGQALENAPASAGRFVEGIVQPIMHPIDTAKSLYHTAEGEIEESALAGLKRAGFPTEEVTAPHAAEADGLNSYFAERYGSVDGFKRALAKDPVGVMSDISAIATGGETVLAKVPGLAGKIGKLAAKAGIVVNPTGKIAKAGQIAAKTSSALGKVAKYTNPANVAGQVIKHTGRAIGKVASEVTGHATHTGVEVVNTAREAGLKGHAASQAFLDNVNKRVTPATLVENAKDALRNMRTERAIQYRLGMKIVGQNPKPLLFTDIDKSLAKTEEIKKFKGVDLQPSTKHVRAAIKGLVEQWKKRSPTAFHTAEGFDALKQMIGDLRTKQVPGSPARAIANDAYHAIRETIVKQEPKYAEVMEDYEAASKELEEVESSLSLGDKAAVDTSLRKLHSMMRDNVNTNFGRRSELGDKLVQHGAPNLKHALAGQAMNSWGPRGLGFIPAAMAVGGAVGGHPVIGGALLAASSPRLVGNVAHGVGVAQRYARKLPGGAGTAALAASQAGRTALDPVDLNQQE